MDNEGETIPKGFDLETSFYHYSLDLAIEMFINDKTSVKAIEYNYSYPSRKRDENKFARFFTTDTEDVKTRLSGRGA